MAEKDAKMLVDELQNMSAEDRKKIYLQLDLPFLIGVWLEWIKLAYTSPSPAETTETRQKFYDDGQSLMVRVALASVCSNGEQEALATRFFCALAHAKGECECKKP